MWSRAELEGAWVGVRAHGLTGEAPDVVGYADLRASFLRGEPVPELGDEGFPARKPSGGTRRLTAMDPAAEARYRAAVARVAPAVERALAPEAVANRVVAAPELRLEPWPRARRRFLGRRDALVRSSGAVAVADVRDCYASIGREAVERGLRAAGCEAEAVGDVLSVVGDGGLPVGPGPSAVLANAVLAEVDRAVAAAGASHVRWVDDFVIGLPDAGRASAVLEGLERALRSIGLRSAGEKTGLVDPGTIGTAAGRSGPVPEPDIPFDPEGIFRELEASGAHAARQIACLRVAARRRWGRAEGAVLERVAGDGTRAGVVRAWAWWALARTSPGVVVNRAGAAGDRPTREGRALALAAARTGRGRSVVRWLGRRPDLAATAAWAAA